MSEIELADKLNGVLHQLNAHQRNLIYVIDKKMKRISNKRLKSNRPIPRKLLLSTYCSSSIHSTCDKKSHSQLTICFDFGIKYNVVARFKWMKIKSINEIAKRDRKREGTQFPSSKYIFQINIYIERYTVSALFHRLYRRYS